MGNDPQKKRIILAEGEPIIAEILPRILTPIGYEVTVVSDGQQALEAIKRESPDLIIVDSDLEKLDCFSLCQLLKNDFITSYIPIIILIEKRQIRKRLLEIKEGIDDYILKPPDPIDLQVRLEIALRRTDHQMHANSLTRLPGNKAIENISREKVEKGTPFSFMYLDIDNFKSFNDTYGYLRGDGVIMQTARILTNCVSKYGDKNDFVGHIGGDDFVVMTTPNKEKLIATEVIKEFKRLIPLHYNEEHRLLGYLVVNDRRDNSIHAPLMSISIAIVNNTMRKIHNIIELTEIASEIKQYLKTIEGSKFLSNRRSINKNAVKQSRAFEKEFKDSQITKEHYEMPIGQILLNAKLLDEEQLREALVQHWTKRELFGQTLVRMNLLSREVLDSYLSKMHA